MAEKLKITEGKWVACGGGDCSCVTIWDREHDVPILKAYRGEWGDEYPVIKVEITDLNRPDNARISAVMETMAYGYIDPKFSAKIVKQVTGLPDLIEAANSFIGEIEDTPLASCREIEGLTSFRVLRNIVDRIKLGGSA